MNTIFESMVSLLSGISRNSYMLLDKINLAFPSPPFMRRFYECAIFYYNINKEKVNPGRGSFLDKNQNQGYNILV